jgi:hypothetical protein
MFAGNFRLLDRTRGPAEALTERAAHEACAGRDVVAKTCRY